MNAEQVVKKILAEAHEQAEAILQQAGEKCDRQTQQAAHELKAYRDETDRLARDAAEDRQARMLAAARMENSRALLAARVELLDEVFQKAQERIVKLPDEQYKTLMSELMKQAVQTGDEEVIVGKDERRIDDALIKQINRQLGTGFKGNLRLSGQRANIAGGFLLSRGKVRMNASVEVLVGGLREAMETELAAKLFAE